VVIETRATLQVGVVDARDYPGMTDFTRSIQTAEQAVLRVK